MTNDDSDLFKKAMQGVKPLPESDRLSHAKTPNKKFRKKSLEPEENTFKLSDHCSEAILPEQHLSYSQPGVQPRYLRQLRQGKILIEAELDLHGFTIDEARNQFTHFIETARNQSLRCVRIIHGKGYRGKSQIPLMKSKVFTWLKQMPGILAFCSCQPKDGGTGAMSVLLSRK